MTFQRRLHAHAVHAAGAVVAALAATALFASPAGAATPAAMDLEPSAAATPADAGAGVSSAATLRIASAFDPQTMDPHSLALLYHTRIVFLVYEGLVGRDADYRIAPALATKWQRTAPTTWRFTLRPGVKFHDGSPFTADDAVFSIQRALRPPSQRQFVLKGVREVRKVDALTIDVELVEPDAVFPEKLPLVAMMSRRWAIAHGVERTQDFDARQETFAARNANGTGPYRLERYEPDTRVVLRANPQWWGRDAQRDGNVDEAVFVTIRSDATRIAALHSGEVDLVLDPPYQAIDELRQDPALAVTQIDSMATQMLAFDQHSDALEGAESAASAAGARRNPFRDRRVRQAVYQAINADLIVQKALRGAGTPTGALFAPIMEGSLPELEARRRYDPVAARELLAQAGWPQGFDVAFDCVNVASRERVCQAIAAMLTQAGIRAHLRTTPGTQFFPMVTQGHISLAEFGFTATTDAWQSLNGLLHTWDSNGAGTFNAGRYSNPRLDALIDAIRVENDAQSRRALVGDALRLAADDLPYVPLYHNRLSWIMQKRVHAVMMPDDTIALTRTSVR
jgi:peptide/nickel transport system substrate-binding protein